MGSIRNSYPSW